MLKIGSLKRSIETNKIQNNKLMEKVKKKKRQTNIRNEKWSLTRDGTEIRQLNIMKILWQYICKLTQNE